MFLLCEQEKERKREREKERKREREKEKEKERKREREKERKREREKEIKREREKERKREREKERKRERANERTRERANENETEKVFLFRSFVMVKAKKNKRTGNVKGRRNKKHQDEVKLLVLSDSGRFYNLSQNPQNIGCTEGACHSTEEFCRTPKVSVMMLKSGGMALPFGSSVSFEQLYNNNYTNDDSAKGVLTKFRSIVKHFAETYLKKSEKNPEFRKEVLEKLEEIKRNVDLEYGTGDDIEANATLKNTCTMDNNDEDEENFNITRRLFGECAKIIQNHSIMGGQIGLSFRRIGDEFAFVMYQIFPHLAMKNTISYDDFYMSTNQLHLLTRKDIVTFSRKIGLTRPLLLD